MIRFIKNYRDYINEIDIVEAIKKLNDLRVLCAVREGKHGVYAINKEIELYLQKHNLIKIDDDNYINRPILVNKNNSELNLFNGDIGLIRKDKSGIKKAYFLDKNGDLRDGILPSLIGGYETVYAMTIHKSQGSEFNNVLIILPEKNKHNLLTNELLYTAVTRAKSKVVIQATEDVVMDTIQTRVSRTSGIIDRIN